MGKWIKNVVLCIIVMMMTTEDDHDKQQQQQQEEEEEEDSRFGLWLAGCSLGTVLLHTPFLHPLVSVNRNFSHWLTKSNKYQSSELIWAHTTCEQCSAVKWNRPFINQQCCGLVSVHNPSSSPQQGRKVCSTVACDADRWLQRVFLHLAVSFDRTRHSTCQKKAKERCILKQCIFLIVHSISKANKVLLFFLFFWGGRSVSI